jgi:hypothetical protein
MASYTAPLAVIALSNAWARAIYLIAFIIVLVIAYGGLFLSDHWRRDRSH